MQLPSHLSFDIVSVGANLLFGVRWIYKKVRNADINSNFINDLGTNHIPHIYQALRQICEKLGIEFQEPPPIQFVRLNGKH